MVRLIIISLMTGIVVSIAGSSRLASADTRPPENLTEGREFRHFAIPEPFDFPALNDEPVQARFRLGNARNPGEKSETGSEKTDLASSKRLGNWLNHDSLTSDARELIEAISNARAHGLNPQAYHLSQITALTELFASHVAETLAIEQKKGVYLANGTPIMNNVTPEIDGIALRFQLNTLLDKSFMQLIRHLGQGVVDGRNLQKRLYRDPPQVDAFLLLLAVSNDELSVSEALASVMPSHPGYQRLTHTMMALLAEQAAGITRTWIPTHEEALTDSQAEYRRLLWNRLVETGDLDPDAALMKDSDSVLSRAVKSFQAKRGLEQDGSVGIKTRTALNAGVTDDIEAVAMSLERFRWLPRNWGERHIFINIPDFQVSLIDNGQTTLSMPAVVGKYQHQTPAFSRDMSYMEYNPTWTVPMSITHTKLIPRERKSPGYLNDNGFEFLNTVGNKLERVPASSVTDHDLDTQPFPYTLRQRSGKNNALGRMKFMMPNKYAIYLHDTPSKKHFTFSHRAYSHGCIRLQDPNALAQALMSGDGYDQSTIDESMQSQHTHRIDFRQPIPTHLVYLTSWVDENEVLQMRPDIYENDDKLLDALRASNTLLSILNTQLPGFVDEKSNS